MNPAPTDPAGPPTSALDTTPPASGTPASAATPDELDELLDTIDARAALVSSFRVRSEVTTSTSAAAPSTAINRVTLLADRSLWSERIDIGSNGPEPEFFASYDPTTGVARAVFPDPAGSPVAQEIVGWNENSVGESVVLGHTPILTPDPNADIRIVDDEHEGRPAWRIEQRTDAEFVPLDASYATAVTSWVDQATGLTVREVWHQVERSLTTGEETVFDRDSTWTQLELDVALPPAFPGTFPENLPVDRSGDPDAFVPAPAVASLVDAFGNDLVLPDLRAGERAGSVGLVWTNYEDGLPAREPGTAMAVTLTVHRGFSEALVSVEIDTSGGQPGGTDIVKIPTGVLMDRMVAELDGSFRTTVPGTDRTLVVTVTARTADTALDLLGRFRPAAEVGY